MRFDICLRVSPDNIHCFLTEIDMPDPDADRPTEIDLEMAQRDKLMELFSRVETFDDRASVIAFCESVVKAQRAD